ncbi:hypothetical protein GGQ22_10095 [Nocardioides sp. zg-579]|uniref:Uncharacterized protein n=1 Tax=Nocardioides marmotae TaxID=2663857 RepID=A0A6I3JBF5_9ACTN|nr:hypothetical protein [Nocardioides marmotae]MTB95435.1 hypothetical protein [Nocardioides marmotae]QKE00875.1 hypothetical protein HPC71_07155 [Nocardioides marmotae]
MNIPTLRVPDHRFQVFVFNKAALPSEESAPTVAHDPVVGMKVVRLVR